MRKKSENLFDDFPSPFMLFILNSYEMFTRIYKKKSEFCVLFLFVEKRDKVVKCRNVNISFFVSKKRKCFIILSDTLHDFKFIISLIHSVARVKL